MISPEIRLMTLKYVAKASYIKVFMNELVRKGIYNKRTGNPYTYYAVKHIFDGKRENFEVENVIMDITSEMKEKREAIKKEYNESLEKDQPHGLQ